MARGLVSIIPDPPVSPAPDGKCALRSDPARLVGRNGIPGRLVPWAAAAAAAAAAIAAPLLNIIGETGNDIG